MSAERLVVDASALIDLFIDDDLGPAVEERLQGADLHAPAHFDLEVLSGLGRMHRAGLAASRVARSLDDLTQFPIERHPLPPLVSGAWRRRQRLRLADALYVELAGRLQATLITTDARLGRVARVAEVVSARG